MYNSQVFLLNRLKSFYINNFFDKQNIDEANIRMYKQADWQALEAERDDVLEFFPDKTGY